MALGRAARGMGGLVACPLNFWCLKWMCVIGGCDVAFVTPGVMFLTTLPIYKVGRTSLWGGRVRSGRDARGLKLAVFS